MSLISRSNLLLSSMKPPYTTFSDESNFLQESTSLVPHVLRVDIHLPFHIHPHEVLVEAKLIAFSNAPFEMTMTYDSDDNDDSYDPLPSNK